MTPDPIRLDVPSRGGATVAALRWSPPGAPRGIVQLTHGMGEHVRRYAPLAGALTDRGWLVQGQDHRGHGMTATEGGGVLGSMGLTGADGSPDGGTWTDLVDDIGRLVERGRADAPGVPLVLLGHSMGSFAAQQYLLDRSGTVDAVVLTGTALLDVMEPQLDLSGPLDLSAFNAAFAPARTDYDWLSRDPEQVDLYVADPWCGFGLDATATRQMFADGRAVGDASRLAAIRPDLPVWVGVGEQDPVGGPVVMAQMLVDRYREAGLTDVTLRVYPGARHEIFNETDRDTVVADVIAALERVAPA